MRSAKGPLVSSRRQIGSAPRGDFFDQALGQEFAGHFVGGAALEVGRQFNGAILPLRGGGHQQKLSVGELVL